MVKDNKHHNIRLTSKRLGLGWVSGPEYCSENYDVVNVCDALKGDSIKRNVEMYGMYQVTALINTPCRKKRVIVCIGFDVNGEFQSCSFNYGQGYFPKKYKEEMFETLCKWAVKDGWIEVTNGNDI